MRKNYELVLIITYTICYMVKINLIRGWVQFGPAKLKEHMEELEGVYEKLRK